MQQKYDVTVVGTGIGGLCAGALLAHRGYKTLVVESRSRIGGRWSTEEYEGFKLATGAVAIHRGTWIDQIFKEVGAPIELVNVPRLWWRIAGKDYEMPPKGSVGTMLDIISKLEVDRAKLLGGIAKEVASHKIMGAFRRGVAKPEEELSFRDWLLQYTDNELVHQVFDIIAVALLCARSHELPAYQMFYFFAKMGGQREFGIAPRGNIVNAESLAKVIKANGDVWINCPVKHIMVKKGKTTGIVVEKDGRDIEIASKAVISNVGPKKTVELAGSENFGAEYLKEMNEKLRPTPVVLILVASDKPLWLEDGTPGSMLVTGARRIQSAFPLTNVSPELAPPGQHLLYCCGAPLSSLHHVNVEEEIRENTLDLKEQFPDFDKHGRILKMDVRDIDDEFPELRTWPGYDMPRETPVENLYNVGDGVKSPGLTGTSSAAESGLRAVELLTKRVKPGGA